ncbi:MAG: bifunctional phosphopantothenoylcysteine decarboxylase/phosphopantothenate--cysteine ligase CoaBC [Halobacteria archaeon]
MHPARRLAPARGRLRGKRILLGVTGSIAAVRSVELARELIRRGAAVRALMTPSAQRILHPCALEYATGEPPVTELTGQVEHVDLVEEADLLLIAPATANSLGKLAHGIDDTPVASAACVAIGRGLPVVAAPAMHEPMGKNPLVAENLERLRAAGVALVSPKLEEEALKLASEEEILLEVERALTPPRLRGKRVLITGGATREAVDPIRVLTNRASGKTGVELAKEACRLGAAVTLVHSGRLGLSQIREVRAESAADMTRAVLKELGSKEHHLLVSAAAISDFVPEASPRKVPSDRPCDLRLNPAPKMVREVRKRFPQVPVVAFKAETGMAEGALLKRVRAWMGKSGASMVVANDVLGGGMGTDDNDVWFVTRRGARRAKGRKEELAVKFWEKAAPLAEQGSRAQLLL